MNAPYYPHRLQTVAKAQPCPSLRLPLGKNRSARAGETQLLFLRQGHLLRLYHEPTKAHEANYTGKDSCKH